MAPGFDQICMSRPRIIYLDLAPASRLSSLLWRDASRMETRRDAFGIIGERRRVQGEDREKTGSSNGRREGGKRKRKGREDADTCERDTRGTLTPPDYPMKRKVIYGSFSGLEGWHEIARRQSNRIYVAPCCILRLIFLNNYILYIFMSCVIIT